MQKNIYTVIVFNVKFFNLKFKFALSLKKQLCASHMAEFYVVILKYS